MITFEFRINDSFLSYPGHPVTVPRSQVDYGEVEKLLSNGDEVWVHLPHVGAYKGLIYHGRAGYGPYYQIRLLEAVPIILTGLETGQRVEVLLFQAEDRVEVHVRRPYEGEYPSAA